MIHLRYTSGARGGQVVQLEGTLATFGRSPACDVVLDDPMVSAVHATLELAPAGYVVTDQQSANGTLVNGARVFRALLRVGDELTLGATGLRVESSDGFAVTLLVERPDDPLPRWPQSAGPLPPRARTPGPVVVELVQPAAAKIRTVPVPPTGLTVGRHPECGLVVDDPKLSALHCRVSFDEHGEAHVTDLGSSNGTFVGDERLQPGKPRLLAPTETARIGGHLLRIRAARAAALTTPTLADAIINAAPQQKSRYYIDVVEGGPTQRAEVRQGVALTIGRLPTSQVVLNDPQASGQHCEVMLGPEGLLLVDVGSRNGTFVVGGHGETRVAAKKPAALHHGDVIRIGDVKLRALIMRPGERASLVKPPSTEAAGAFEKVISGVYEPPVVAHVPKALRGAKLTFVAGTRAGTELAVVPLEKITTTIGRASDCDVMMDDRSVSAQHCDVTATESGFVVRDLASSNGTFVNGEAVVGERLLQPGDLLRVGLDAVCEFSLEGAARQTLSLSVDAAGAMPAKPRPRFVVRGAVLQKDRITIGRDAACDLFLDDPQVARTAAEIAWFETRFIASPVEVGGLMVNGAVVAQSPVKTGDVLTVGKWLLRVEVSGARLTIHERAPRVSANFSWAREETTSAQAPVIAEAARPVYKTVFATDAAQLNELAPKRAPKKAAPKWKATSDLVTDRNRGGAALIGFGVASALVGFVLAGPRERVFLDGELARAHDSRAFLAAAQKNSLEPGCRACHSLGGEVAAARCQSCHTEFKPHKQHVAAGLRCSDCHEEHRGAEAGRALVARASCAKSGCHDTQRPPHRKLTTEAATAFTAALKMAAPKKMRIPRGDPRLAQEQLHAIHVDVNRRCMACHTAADGVSPGVASRACFRCHDAPDVNAQLASVDQDLNCAGCHGGHDLPLARVSDLGPRWSGNPRGGGPAAAAGVLALFFIVGGFSRVYFGRRVERVAKLAREVDEVENPPEERAVEKVDPDKGAAAVKLKVNVNLEKCVGCANCVNACPTAVLEIRTHKSTVVAESNCTSCRACEEVCPSGALTMAPEGAPPRLIDLPDLDPHYQTNVRGLYLIGEAAGKSLVKNSANLGRVVVEHMIATGLRPGAAARLGAQVEVLSIGSGPGGLSAAITARRAGLSYAIVEKERQYASTIRYCPRGKIFQAEPYDVKNISPLPIEDGITKEELLVKWDEVLAQEGIDVRLDEEVLDVRKQSGMFVVTTTRGIITALKVVMAPGTRARPRKLGVAGQELEKVSYMLVDPDEHQLQDILVVGGGDSAVECALALAEGNRVTLSYRREAFTRVKPRNLERLNAALQANKLRVVFSSAVQEIRLDSVVLGIAETVESLPNHFVYCLLGGDLPTVWLQQLGVKYVQKPEGWNPGPTDSIVINAAEVAA